MQFSSDPGTELWMDYRCEQLPHFRSCNLCRREVEDKSFMVAWKALGAVLVWKWGIAWRWLMGMGNIIWWLSDLGQAMSQKLGPKNLDLKASRLFLSQCQRPSKPERRPFWPQVFFLGWRTLEAWSNHPATPNNPSPTSVERCRESMETWCIMSRHNSSFL